MTGSAGVGLRLLASAIGLAIVVSAAAAYGAARTDAVVIVSLRPSSTVRGPEIQLGEIADIQGKDSGLTERLRTIDVAHAPLPGLTRTLDVAYVKARLRLAQVDIGSLVMDGPAVVSVTTASQQISGPDLIEAVRSYIVAARTADAGRLSVSATGNPPPLLIPAGALELKVRTRPPAELHGTVAATVEVWVDGVLIRSVSVPVRVGVLFDVLVAVRPIARAQVITAEDVRVEQREITTGQEPLRERAAAIGRQAARNIAAGESIVATLINEPPLVRRGDIVLLTAEGRGVRAVAQGEAREDGKAGQVIRVRSLTSNRDVYGQVDAERSVRVAF